MHVQNAKIVSTHLGQEDHGIMTVFLNLQMGGTAQSFGGWGLGDYRTLGLFINRVLDTVGVDRWEKLPGQVIQIKRAEPKGKIVAIGDIFGERWFDPASDL